MSFDELLAAYPVVVDLPVVWGDMDAFNHVNNIIYFRYFESARITYFERSGMMEAMEETGVGPILASIQCRYKVALTYPDRIKVGARVVELSEDRCKMVTAVASERLGCIAAEGEGVIVSFDYRKQTKAPFPANVVDHIRGLERGLLIN